MISYLKGNIVAQQADSIILDVQGVGYKVFLAKKTLAKLPLASQQAEIFCHLCLKEETIELYGFLSQEALRLFEILNNISGIGPKAALALSSLGTIDELRKAIQKKDEAFFAGTKGIGKKKIQKVILELTGKLEEFEGTGRTEKDEAITGLMSLGFSSQQARNALGQVPKDITQTEQKIKEALKILSKS